MTSPERDSMPDQAVGLPATWFQALGEANRRFPQGDSILDFALAHTFFSSIANGEIHPQKALTSSMTDEQATQSPQSLLAAAEHRQRAKEDVSYRRSICKPTALIPVFESVKTATEVEAASLMNQKGIAVPQPVLDWFKRGRDWALSGQQKQ